MAGTAQVVGAPGSARPCPLASKLPPGKTILQAQPLPPQPGHEQAERPVVEEVQQPQVRGPQQITGH